MSIYVEFITHLSQLLGTAITASKVLADPSVTMSDAAYDSLHQKYITSKTIVETIIKQLDENEYYQLLEGTMRVMGRPGGVTEFQKTVENTLNYGDALFEKLASHNAKARSNPKRSYPDYWEEKIYPALIAETNLISRAEKIKKLDLEKPRDRDWVHVLRRALLKANELTERLTKEQNEELYKALRVEGISTKRVQQARDKVYDLIKQYQKRHKKQFAARRGRN